MIFWLILTGMKEFDTYLFDFDGTLVDSYESLVKVFSGAYSKVGVKVPEGYTLRLMRCPLYVGYEELHGPDDENSKKIFGDEIVRLLNDEEVLKATKTYEEVKDTLVELVNRGKKLGIVTSNSKTHVKDVLGFIGLDESLFSIIVGNEATKKHKPNPDPILKGLELLGINRNGVCYVGDALDDMRCAINAEVTPILVDRLNEHGDACKLTIYKLDELLKY